MQIAVCLKQVVTRDAPVRVDEAKTWIRDQDASFELNEPDAYALEAALRLKEQHGGEVIAVSAGPSRVTQALREALARGADRALHIEGDALARADAFGVAEALANAIRGEKFDLVLTGLQSDGSGLRAGRGDPRRKARHGLRDDHHGPADRRRVAARQA